MPKNTTLVTTKLPASGKMVFRVISSNHSFSITRGIFSCKSNADAWLATQKDTHWYKTEKVDIVFDKVDHPDWSMMDPHEPTLIELMKDYMIFTLTHPEYVDSDLNAAPDEVLEAYFEKSLKGVVQGAQRDLDKINRSREADGRSPLPKPDVVKKMEEALARRRAH